MRRLLATAALLWLGACGSAPTPPTWDNESRYPTSFAEDIWATTEGVAGDSIDLSDFIIYIHANVGEGCNGVAECSNPAAHYIHTAFPTAASLGLTQSVTDETIAGAFCHELGHVHFYETTGDADPSHKHTEWYDYNTVGTVCYRVADLFVDFQP